MIAHTLRAAALAAAFALAAPASAAPRIDLYVSAGTTRSAEVRGRAFDEGGAAKQPTRPLSRLGKNLDRLLADDLEDREVEVKLLDRTARVRTDDEGLFRVAFEGLPPGVHATAARLVDGSARGTGKLVVAAAGAPLVLSDIDDTIVQTHVTEKRKLVEAALFEDGRTQAPVPGMSALLRCLRRGKGGPEATVHFLSGSPLSFYGRITEFLGRERHPLGEVLLRNYGLGVDDDPLDPLAYKLSKAPRVLDARPDAKVVLVGDSGEQDPEIYAELARRYPGRVAAIYVRLVEGGRNDDPARFPGQVTFRSPVDAARDAARRGLVDAACEREVAQAIGSVK